MTERHEAPGAPAHRLGEIPLFASLSAAVLAELARVSRPRRYPAGQILWSEGDPGDALLVLEVGQLRISRYTSGGAEAVLAVVEAPAAVGELALLDGAPRDAAVVAQRAVSVRLVPRSIFLDLVLREPAAVRGLLATLAGLVRHGNARHARLLGLDVPGRLAAWLLGRTATVGSGAGAAGSTIMLGRTQGELAAELGATRESLNRALRGFAEQRLIVVDGDQVTLLDPAGLDAYTS